jgi:hypothetical protein
LFEKKLNPNIPWISSFNRSGIEPSSSSSSASQAPHHMMRASARDSYNPKSASLTAQQQTPKIAEKLKCVMLFFFFR